MRLYRVQHPSPPPDIPGTPVTGVVTQWIDDCVRCLRALKRISASPSPSAFLSPSPAFASSVSSSELFDYVFEETWMTLLLIVLLAFVLRQLFIAYRVERKWQALQSHVRATVAVQSFDAFLLKDAILNFFSSSACSNRVSMRYTAELFSVLEQRADKYPPQDLRALASEIAALGAAVDLAALHIVIKRQRSRRQSACCNQNFRKNSFCRKNFVHTQILIKLSGFFRLLLYSLCDTLDLIFNDPASSLVALCM